MSLVYFVILVGVLIFVHELGHFVCAKLFGVKVLTFSLGFGPKVASVRRGETEYRVALFPFGGYVRMLGESPQDVVAPDERERSFGAQPLLRRIVIVFAGPAMNLLFPLALFFMVALWSDVTLTPSVVGSVKPGLPADGIMLPGDTILSVDGTEVRSFEEMARAVRERPGEATIFELERTVYTSEGERTMRLAEVLIPTEARHARIAELDVYEQVGLVGVRPTRSLPIVGVTGPDTIAAIADIRTFDRVVGIGGAPIRTFDDLRRPLENTRAMTPLALLRPVPVEAPLGGLVEMDVYDARFTSIVPRRGRGDPLLRIGLEKAALYVAHVTEGAPEARMGLVAGDRLISIDHRPLRTFEQLMDILRVETDRPHVLAWRRGSSLHEGRLVLHRERGVGPYGERYDRAVIGMRPWLPVKMPAAVAPSSTLMHAARSAVSETRRMAELTIYSAVRLVQGRLTLRAIGGPISIYAETGRAAQEGGSNYLRLMAFISVSLGLLNLLPIPTLDGGHLLFFLVEAVRRRPLPRAFRERAALAGLVLLISIMLLAVINDINRFTHSEEPRVTVQR